MTGIESKHDAEELRQMIEAHRKATGSKIAEKILEDFDRYLPCFKKIIPNDYNRMLSAISKMEEQGLSREQAELEAFLDLQ